MKKCPVPGCWRIALLSPELAEHLFRAHRIEADPSGYLAEMCFEPGIQLVKIADGWWWY